MAINFNKAEFILSAASPAQFIRDGRKQLAFAGRSNVGKSSVINRILNRKNLARVGASPGKTTQINYFLIDELEFVKFLLKISQFNMFALSISFIFFMHVFQNNSFITEEKILVIL